MVLRIKNFSVAKKQFNVLLNNNAKIRNRLIVDEFVSNRNKIKVRNRFRQNFKIANVLENLSIQDKKIPYQARNLSDKVADVKVMSFPTQHVLNKADYLLLKWRSIEKARYYNIYL